MGDQKAAPRLEDVVSVGTRIRWGTILAGAMLALGLYFLLTILGAAVGLSISDRVNPASLQTGAVVWACLITCVALFVGSLVTSLFTVGENKVEAVLYGVIMWALLFALLLVLGAAGIRGGFNAMVSLANTGPTASSQSWETGARDAGVPADLIEDWRRRLGAGAAKTIPDPQQQQAMADGATRLAWFTFAGIWVSMLAAAAGALVGAGPTFRLVGEGPSRRVVAT